MRSVCGRVGVMYSYVRNYYCATVRKCSLIIIQAFKYTWSPAFLAYVVSSHPWPRNYHPVERDVSNNPPCFQSETQHLEIPSNHHTPQPSYDIARKHSSIQRFNPSQVTFPLVLPTSRVAKVQPDDHGINSRPTRLELGQFSMLRRSLNTGTENDNQGEQRWAGLSKSWAGTEPGLSPCEFTFRGTKRKTSSCKLRFVSHQITASVPCSR